jgi:hypothetical protein
MSENAERTAIRACRGALEYRATKIITPEVLLGVMRKITYQLPAGIGSYRALVDARESAKLAIYRVASEPNLDGSPNQDAVKVAYDAIARWEREADALSL